MFETFSAGVLLVLVLVAFGNVKDGTLADWARAKFFNSAEPTRSFQEAVATGDTPIIGAGLGGLRNPLPGAAVSGVFGEARPGHDHEGVDLSASQGTPVASAGAGKVSFAGASGSYGLRVDVDHGGGVTTRYAHLDRITVRVGQMVQAGTTLGNVGSTGRSSGPHLHFEVRRGGVPVDPGSIVGPQVVSA